MGFWGLVGFLSRLPARDEPPEELSRSVHLIPFVGILTGILLGSMALIEFTVLPRWLAVLAFLLSFFAINGILHLDGLADLADAISSGAGVESRLRIMKDPHVGTAGVVAVTLFIAALVLSLWSMPLRGWSGILPVPSSWPQFGVPFGLFFSIIIAQVNASSAMVCVMASGRPSPGSVLARPFIENTTPGKALLSLLVAGTVSWVSGGWLVTATLASLGIAIAMARIARNKLGGVSGDVLGASYSVTFAATMVLAAFLPSTLVQPAIQVFRSP